MRKLTQAELARTLNVSRQAIGDLVARGILVVDETGRVDEADARARIAEQVRPSGKTAAATTAGSHAKQAQSEGQTSMNYHVARTLREATEASIAQIKLRQMSGELIAREPATQATFTAFRSLRDALTTLGRNLSPRLAALNSDSRAIEMAIDAAIRDIIANFQRKTLPSLAARLGNSADASPPASATAAQP